MTGRRIRRAIALVALTLLAFGQTVAAAHACTLGAGAAAAASASASAEPHGCCPDESGPAPAGNDCKQHCLVASNAPELPADVPAFLWVAGFAPKAATPVAQHRADRAFPHALAPPALPPLARSQRLLI